MNYTNVDLKIYKLSLFILGKIIFKMCREQGTDKLLINAFCTQRNVSKTFHLKYCDGLTAMEIAEKEYLSDERSVYKRIDQDMIQFGIWLSHDCLESESFENIRKRLEMVLFSEYVKRKIPVSNKKAWRSLSADCIKMLY